MREIFWVLPILFMFHDFEEIIFLENWVKNLDRKRLDKHYAKRIIEKILLNLKNTTTANFAIGVFCIYMLLISCTFIAYIWNLEEFWISLFLVFTLHLVFHCIQAIIFKGYIPALYTSLICIPICMYILFYIFSKHTFSCTYITLQTIVMSILCMALLYFIHKKILKIKLY